MTSSAGFAEVIGDPITHSRSPEIHRFWLGRLGLAGDYRATRVTRAELAQFLAGRRQDPAWRGCNVTMPLKLDALMLADDIGDRAVTAGAANLLTVKDGRLKAWNSDVGALLTKLRPLAGPGKAAVTLLGNGGAARAALVALRMLGQDEVQIHARDITAAYALALEFGLQRQPRPFDAPIESTGLINATPVGMRGAAPWTVDISAMADGGWVVDMVTDPLVTTLIEAARARGLRSVDGLDLLVEQAAASFALLFGRDAPREHDAELMAELRG